MLLNRLTWITHLWLNRLACYPLRPARWPSVLATWPTPLHTFKMVAISLIYYPTVVSSRRGQQLKFALPHSTGKHSMDTALPAQCTLAPLHVCGRCDPLRPNGHVSHVNALAG